MSWAKVPKEHRKAYEGYRDKDGFWMTPYNRHNLKNRTFKSRKKR